jgi:hypothetical protein
MPGAVKEMLISTKPTTNESDALWNGSLAGAEKVVTGEHFTDESELLQVEGN